AALVELRAFAREHFNPFVAGRGALPPASTPAFLPVALVPAYLARMERRDYDPFKTPIDVPQWRRQWILWRGSRGSAEGGLSAEGACPPPVNKQPSLVSTAASRP